MGTPERIAPPIKGFVHQIEDLIKGDPTGFFMRMVAKMEVHAHKGDSWKTTLPPVLMQLMEGEVREAWDELYRLYECSTQYDPDILDRFQDEVADVANFALMLYLKAERLKKGE